MILYFLCMRTFLYDSFFYEDMPDLIYAVEKQWIASKAQHEKDIRKEKADSGIDK